MSLPWYICFLSITKLSYSLPNWKSRTEYKKSRCYQERNAHSRWVNILRTDKKSSTNRCLSFQKPRIYSILWGESTPQTALTVSYRQYKTRRKENRQIVQLEFLYQEMCTQLMYLLAGLAAKSSTLKETHAIKQIR